MPENPPSKQQEEFVDDAEKSSGHQEQATSKVMNSETEHDDEGVGADDEEMASLPRRRKKRYAVSVRWEREYEEERSRGRRKQLCTGTAEDFHTCCCCCSRRVGSMFFMLETRDGTPIIVAGPCWPFCTFVTVPLILVCSGLVSYFVVLNKDSGLPWWFAFIYFPFVAMTLISLFCVSCRDPGLLERVTDEEAGNGGWFWNEQVGSFRPPGAMYCRECKVLIQDYDHLCPWTGTGIGRGNMWAFKWFVISINILCYFSIALVAYFLLSGL